MARLIGAPVAYASHVGPIRERDPVRRRRAVEDDDDRRDADLRPRLDTDYLILGAGAMGLAFADVILSEHPTSRIVVVDRRDSPGGHWNDNRGHRNRRIVDGTFMTVEVPFVRPPPYPVDPDVSLVPPNGLPQIKRPWERYVVIGAGKTGIDAILFLLDEGVSPDRIQWIVSNDSWLWDRASVQPGVVLETLTAQVESIVNATNIDEVFLQLEPGAVAAPQPSERRAPRGAAPVPARGGQADADATQGRRLHEQDAARAGEHLMIMVSDGRSPGLP